MPVIADVSADQDILTLAEAKAALNIPAATADYDTELAQVITAASRFVDSVFGPVVRRTITDERHYGAGTSVTLNQSPVASVTTVTEYSGGVATVLTAESDTVAGTYTLDDNVLHRRASWGGAYFARQSVVVTCVAGRYASTATVDAKFKEAAVVALIHFWQHRGANSGAGTFGGDGAPFGGVPFSTDTLRKKLQAMFVEDALLPGIG